MQSTTLSLVLLTSVIVSGYHTGAKLRRDGTGHLYPFPRVGRSLPRRWEVPMSLRDRYYEPVYKRQLYAFPRVGRSDPAIHQEETGEESDTGMWFGPRLGRSVNIPQDDYIFKNNDRSEPELLESENNADRMKRKAEWKLIPRACITKISPSSANIKKAKLNLDKINNRAIYRDNVCKARLSHKFTNKKLRLAR